MSIRMKISTRIEKQCSLKPVEGNLLKSSNPWGKTRLQLRESRVRTIRGPQIQNSTLDKVEAHLCLYYRSMYKTNC